jgi:hypothetical protein
MSTHCTLNAVVDEVEGDADRAVVTSLQMNLGDDSPPSVVSLSFITQQLTRVDSRWLIERRSVRSGAEEAPPRRGNGPCPRHGPAKGGR